MKHVCTFIALSLFWEWLLTTKWKWFLEETGGLCTFWPNQSQFPARSSNRTNWRVKTSNAGIFPQWKAFGNWMKTWGGFRSLTRSITICPSNQAALVLRWNRVCLTDSVPILGHANIFYRISASNHHDSQRRFSCTLFAPVQCSAHPPDLSQHCWVNSHTAASLSSRPLTTDKPSETSSCVIFSLLFSLSLFSKVVITHRHQCNDFVVQCAWQKEECFNKTEDSSQVDICTHFYFQRLQRQESEWRQTSIAFYSYLLFLRFSLFCNCNMAL